MTVLETERLTLRHYRPEDAAGMFAIFSDPETMAYYPGPFSFRQTEEWIGRNIGRYAADGFGLWAVCLKESGQLIGDCGLIRQMVEGDSEVEVGYHIARSCWNRGYATEAAAACAEYGFRKLGLSRLCSIIAPGNTASIRVAEKIGFVSEREVRIFGRDHVLYTGSGDKEGK